MSLGALIPPSPTQAPDALSERQYKTVKACLTVLRADEARILHYALEHLTYSVKDDGQFDERYDDPGALIGHVLQEYSQALPGSEYYEGILNAENV